jgi:hypothetical protein
METTIWPKKLPTQNEVEVLEKQEEAKVVSGLVKKSNRILATISTHRFPIDLFPDTLNIEEGRITIITRNYFFSSQVHSVDIKDISNIFINMTPFFAQLVVVSKTFTENDIRIGGLRRNEAIFARRIIEGLRTFKNNQIDTSVYTKKELVAKLKELSTTEIVT